MRLGMMLRSYDEKGGVGVYTRNVVKELLALDSGDHFFLYYRNPGQVGRFADRNNVTERFIPGFNKAIWDQVAIPFACARDRLDLLFHPKFTIPFLAPCKTVMVVHGADWFLPDQAVFYDRLDVAYIRAVMPLYFKKCSRVISVSELTTRNFNRVLDLPPDKIETVYFGPARYFEPVKDQNCLDAVKERYDLPARYIFTLAKRKGGARKNLGQIVNAYALYHQSTADPYPLVVGGKDCHLFRDEYGIPKTGYGKDIHFPGWIAQQDMPAVYSGAIFFLYPSNLEAFPIPLTEAMACGTPIITSNVNGLSEIAGEAALLVNPTDAEEIAASMKTLSADLSLRVDLAAKGMERAALFTWERCAKQTMQILKDVAG